MTSQKTMLILKALVLVNISQNSTDMENAKLTGANAMHTGSINHEFQNTAI